MRTRIFHTVNAGLYIRGKNVRLLVDGLHRGKAEGLSPCPAAIAEQAAGGTGLFSDLDGLLFTHLHGDHFDADLVQAVLALPAPPRLIGAAPRPEGGFSGAVPAAELELKGARIHLLPTVHDGAQFAAVPHRSFLIQMEDAAFFIAGDAALDEGLGEKLLALNGGRGPAAAFLNPMQLLSPETGAFLRRISARRIFIYHLPFPEDDVFQYAQTSKWAVRARLGDFPGLTIPGHMQWMDWDGEVS